MGRKKKSEYQCSTEECESSGDIVFCPNRFTGFDMLDIQSALKLQEGLMRDIKNNFDGDSMNVNGEEIDEDFIDKKLADYKKLINKVDRLVALADAFYEKH